MTGRSGGTPERPATFFTGPEEFRAWLERHHETAPELWMGLYKKHVPDRGLTWEQAVPEALCFGWIDSVAQRIDEDAVRQRWTPRRAGSNWSNVNIALVAQLQADGRMHPAGVAAFERRRADRSGVYVHENEAREFPPDFLRRLEGDAAASAFWAEATPSYRRVATAWVVSAKQEGTRERRMDALLADCAAGRLITSQRYGADPRWRARAAAAAAAASDQAVSDEAATDQAESGQERSDPPLAP